MKIAQLNEMIGGWFVGNFEPSILKHDGFEVAIKYYKKGDRELKHMHKIGTEITVIESGKAIMLEKTLIAGDIIMLSPGEATGFVALEDTTTVVVKFPSVLDDKYMVDDDA